MPSWNCIERNWRFCFLDVRSMLGRPVLCGCKCGVVLFLP